MSSRTHTLSFDVGPNAIVGIDQSLAATGVAVLRNNTLFTITNAPKGLKDIPRLEWFSSYFDRLFGVGVAAIGMEGYSFGSPNACYALGELGAVVKLSAFRAGHTPVIVPPNSVKKFATGNGNAKKELVLKGVFQRFGIDTNDNNQADATAIALIVTALKFPALEISGVTKTMRDDIKKLSHGGQ